MRSPSLRRACLTFSPLTKVPLVRAQVLDGDLAAGDGDLRVLARDHVLDEHHVQLARAADDDLLVRLQRELAALVLAGDELEGVGFDPLGVLTVRTSMKRVSMNISPPARPSAGSFTRFRYISALLLSGLRASTSSHTFTASARRPPSTARCRNARDPAGSSDSDRMISSNSAMRLRVVALVPAGIAQLDANVDELRAQAQRAAVLADRLVPAGRSRRRRRRCRRTCWRSSPCTKGSMLPGPLRCRARARLVDLLRLGVLAHVVVDDRQVQRGLGVRRG